MNQYVFAFKYGTKKMKLILPLLMLITITIDILRWFADKLEVLGFKLTSWSGKIDYRLLKSNYPK